MYIEDLIDRPIDLMSVSFLRIKHLFHYILNHFCEGFEPVSNWFIYDSKFLRMVVMLDERRKFSSWTSFDGVQFLTLTIGSKTKLNQQRKFVIIIREIL